MSLKLSTLEGREIHGVVLLNSCRGRRMSPTISWEWGIPLGVVLAQSPASQVTTATTMLATCSLYCVLHNALELVSFQGIVRKEMAAATPPPQKRWRMVGKILQSHLLVLKEVRKRKISSLQKYLLRNFGSALGIEICALLLSTIVFLFPCFISFLCLSATNILAKGKY